jgi:hypothetical protein
VISLDESNGSPSWKIGRFEWELHISQFEGSPSEFLEALRNDRLECIFIGKGRYNSYFLVIEPQANSATRIGAGEALFFRDGTVHRFADEIDFKMIRKEIRLI